MSQKKVMKSLKHEFPDMTQSLLNDLAQHSNALSSLKEGKSQKSQDELQELCLNFNHLPRELIEQFFEENKQDFDKTVTSLMDYCQSQAVNEKASELMGVFQTLSKETIQKVLDENEGDIESTTQHLIDLVTAQEAEKERKRLAEEQRLKKEQGDASLRASVHMLLRQKFGADVDDKEIARILQENNWNVQKATATLHCMTIDRKKAALKAQFPRIPDSEIAKALDACDYDKLATADYLNKKFPVVEKSAPKPAAHEDALVLEKIEQNILTQSLILGKQLEGQIIREREQKLQEAKDLFRNRVCEVIESQARGGAVPGFQAPEVKDVKKPAPVQESEQIEDMKLDSSQSELLSSVTPYPVKLTVNPTIIDVGNPITVHYEITSGESNSWDWIGMFSLDKLNKEYLSYQYRGKGEKEGTVTFTPTQYGSFEFRYFPAGTMLKSNYQHLGKSNSIRVGPQFTVDAKLSDDAKNIDITWTKVSGNVYSSAWVGLYEVGAKNPDWTTWVYASTPALTLDAPLKPTQYEVRFFSHSYVCVATSKPVQITGADSLAISIADNVIYVDPHVLTVDPHQSSAWVGLFFADQQDNRQWIKYKYLKDRFAKTQFRFPKQGGTYQVRLFADKSYNVIVSSPPFTIEVK